MPSKLFEFLEQFMTGTFLIKIDPIRESWMSRSNFDSAGKSENLNLYTFFVTFTLLLFDCGICLCFNKKLTELETKSEK